MDCELFLRNRFLSVGRLSRRLPIKLHSDCDQGTKLSKSVSKRIANFAYSSIGLHRLTDVMHQILGAAGRLFQLGRGRLYRPLIASLFEAGLAFSFYWVGGRVHSS